MSIDVDSSGNAYVSGDVRSPDFRRRRRLPAGFAGGGGDAAVVKVNPWGPPSPTRPTSAARPTTHRLGHRRGLHGPRLRDWHDVLDGFPDDRRAFQPVTQALPAPLMPTGAGCTNGASLVYSTFLGGTDYDLALGIDVDDDCHAYVMAGAGPSTIRRPQRVPEPPSTGTATRSSPTWTPRPARRPARLARLGPTPTAAEAGVQPGRWSVSGDGLDYALDGGGARLDEDHELWACLCPFLPYVHAWETGHADQHPWTGTSPNALGARRRERATVRARLRVTAPTSGSTRTPRARMGRGGGGPPRALPAPDDGQSPECSCPPPFNGNLPSCTISLPSGPGVPRCPCPRRRPHTPDCTCPRPGAAISRTANAHRRLRAPSTAWPRRHR